MPILRPFRGLRYSEKAGPLGDLICPLVPPLPSELYENPFQAVHLVSPKREAEDRSKYVAFARAMAALALWRREGILELDATLSFYRWDLGHGAIWIGLARITELPEQPTEKRDVETRHRRLEATRLHAEFPSYRSEIEPSVLTQEPLFEGFAKVTLAEPWTPDLEYVGGAAALEAARAHAANLGSRVAGRGEEWVPVAVSTGSLGPVSGLPLFTEAQIGDHSRSEPGARGEEPDPQDIELGSRIQSHKGDQSWPSHWAGWLFWCHGDHLREDSAA